MTACERYLKELESRFRELKLANQNAGKPDATDKARAKAEEAERTFDALRDRIAPLVNETGTPHDKSELAKWESLRALQNAR